MQIKWYGQACFLITRSDGLKIVTDPYTPETAGYHPVTEKTDLVIRSSDNDSFHCRADLIPGNPCVITALDLAQSGGETTELGVRVQAIEAMEALNHKYHDPDQNGMYRFDVDGMNIGHMGDMGNALSDKQIEFFKGIDILLALAGGHPTLELDDLKTLIDAVQPRLIIPMHFRTLRVKLRHMLWIESFLNYFDDKDIDYAYDDTVTLTRESLPAKTRVLALDYA